MKWSHFAQSTFCSSNTTIGCAVVFAMAVGFPAPALGGMKRVEIAAAISLTGDAGTLGAGSLEGIKLALEEANAGGEQPRIDLQVYDTKSDPEVAKQLAERVVVSGAVAALGPTTSLSSPILGPVFTRAGMASISPTATSDMITENATTFRTLFTNAEQGEMLATYLSRVLGQRQAAVIVSNDLYGQTLEKGFRSTAERLGIDTIYVHLQEDEKTKAIVTAAAKEIGERPVVLAMLDADGGDVLPVLRRTGVKGPYLGGNAIGVENFNAHFAAQPEEKEQPGYFCEGVYGISPMLFDSGNAEAISFAERFRVRFGHEPGWTAAAGYDAARFAVVAIRAVQEKVSGAPSMRAAVFQYLLGLDDPGRAQPGLLGPLFFDELRGRSVAMRMGRFRQGRFESAPLQIVPVVTPIPGEIESGAVFPLHPGKYARLQQVIYSGMFVNEVQWLDQSRFTFAADFYVWLRFARTAEPLAADPTEIKFPDLSAGVFDLEHPLEARELPDGSRYRLWRVHGEFRNPFDLRRYPFDRQQLDIRFVHLRAPADQVVYVLDQRASVGLKEGLECEACTGTSKDAFRALSQWRFVDAQQSRVNFVARSSLGDPQRLGRINYRELSGYRATIVLARRALPTLMKNLFPLLLMTCMMYASLHFPPPLVQTKVAVAMSGVLTGMVLLNLVNSGLGAIGYTVAVEYAFYVYFGLGVLCIVSVLYGEHLRETGRKALAERWDFWSRAVFLAAVFGLVVSALIYQREPR